MKKIRVKMVGKGTEKEPFTVNYPTWMLSGAPDYQKMECDILIFDDETEVITGKTKLNQKLIRKKYRKGWSKFNVSDVEV